MSNTNIPPKNMRKASGSQEIGTISNKAEKNTLNHPWVQQINNPLVLSPNDATRKSLGSIFKEIVNLEDRTTTRMYLSINFSILTQISVYTNTVVLPKKKLP